MMKTIQSRTLLIVGLCWMMAVGLSRVSFSVTAQQDELVKRGEYITRIAGCASCHTPFQDAYLNFDALALDQIKTLAYEEQQAQDFSRLMSGGRVFPLGPAGIVISRNLTPDTETGLGNWSDAQIETAIRTGQRIDGRVLFPLMPYHVYNGMAAEDMAALIAYLRTIPAVNNPVPSDGQVSTQGFQPLPMPTGITAPEKADQVAYGGYLVNNLLACTDCHTPIDPATGAPILEKFLGGGQPYEGPWGIVYGGNITPDEETGIASWSEAELKRVLIAGIRPDGRRVAVMPWEVYKNLTGEDLDAVIAYLRHGLAAVRNEVPANSITPDMLEMVDVPVEETPASTNLLPVILGAGIVLVVLLVVFMRRRK